jgi:hypothetical protein
MKLTVTCTGCTLFEFDATRESMVALVSEVEQGGPPPRDRHGAEVFSNVIVQKIISGGLPLAQNADDERAVMNAAIYAILQSDAGRIRSLLEMADLEVEIVKDGHEGGFYFKDTIGT